MKIQKTLSNLDGNPSNYSIKSNTNEWCNYSIKSNTNERWGIKGLFDSDVQITILSV